MQNGTDIALRLMIVDDSVEDAEAIVSALRNAGIAVRPLRPANVEELSAMLAGQTIDLVLADQQSGGLPLDEVLQLVRGSG
jgi:CheY-like chemotaxis protein